MRELKEISRRAFLTGGSAVLLTAAAPVTSGQAFAASNTPPDKVSLWLDRGRNWLSGKRSSLHGLVNHNGHAILDAQFDGKYRLVFFGFYQCSAICPVAAYNIGEALKSIQKKTGRDITREITPIFVTIDPYNDRPAVLKKFLEDYHPSFVGLTTLDPQNQTRIDEIAKNYRAMVPGSAGHDHTPFAYLMDKEGDFIRLVETQSGYEPIEAALAKQLGIDVTQVLHPDPVQPA